MLGVKGDSGDWAPAALIRVRCPESENDVHFLVAPFSVIPSTALSALSGIKIICPRVFRETPFRATEWVRRTWTDFKRGVTFVELEVTGAYSLIWWGVISHDVISNVTTEEKLSLVSVNNKSGLTTSVKESVKVKTVKEKTIEIQHQSVAQSTPFFIKNSNEQLVALLPGNSPNENVTRLDSVVKELIEDRSRQLNGDYRELSGSQKRLLQELSDLQSIISKLIQKLGESSWIEKFKLARSITGTDLQSTNTFVNVENILAEKLRLSKDTKKPIIAGISLWASGSETLIRPKAVILADNANSNIKVLNLGSVNELRELYHCENGSRVHTVFFTRGWISSSEETRGSRFCIIQSKDVSRQVGVLIRNETLFDLVQLIEEDKDRWIVEIKKEFYRVDQREIGAEYPQTSLFRWGKRVLCAVADSYRASAFQEISLNSAGITRFDTPLVDLKPFESSGGPRLAIAFRDDSIRLFSHEETANVNNEIFELKELFRIQCENVYNILTLVPRLIVAERLENEEIDRLWLCRLDAERLDLEGWVVMKKQIGVQSWIGCAEAQAIYVIDTNSSELRVFDLKEEEPGILKEQTPIKDTLHTMYESINCTFLFCSQLKFLKQH